MTQKKTTRSPITPVRFNEADHALIEKIQAKTGVTAVSEVIRMGLRALGEKLGIKI
jgi:hypothetical protein